ncbi:MAG: 2-succinyl-6-hydroxy-2,4-cyclohexadiene-1-carboxylate synthase [candidate division Zixibacteria bacterium]|nr:2-succinyl-6-hydroxy-2,4-cyclohexadiene-1-carboxylate synthase [candidate division Zixibacteria bacterium]
MGNINSLNFHIEGDISKQKILFLHGFMGSRLDWIEVIENFLPDYCCLTLDLPGHGQSKIYDDEQYRIEKTATIVINTLQKNKISKCHLIGYSMGGRLAYYLLVHYPEYFEKAVIESATPGIISTTERRERILDDYELAAKLDEMNQTKFNEFLIEWYNLDLFKSLKNDSDKFDNLIEKRKINNRKKLAHSLRMMGAGAQISLWDKVIQIKNEVLLIAGENDDKFKKINNNASKLNKLIVNHVINSAGHNAHYEQMDIFVKIVKNYFK